jgi:hypothetical protein
MFFNCSAREKGCALSFGGFHQADPRYKISPLVSNPDRDSPSLSTSTISVHCFQHPDITGASTLLRVIY